MLTENEKSVLLAAARASLTAAIRKRVLPPCGNISPNLQKPGAAFVTLHRGDRLRGCIGYITPMKSLYDTVSETAVKAGTQDPRFTPVEESELPRLTFSISVLSPLRQIRTIEEIEVGVHGILLQTQYARGLLLPQVAVEYGWDREQFLDETAMKAGLPAKAWKLPEVEIQIFTAEEFSENMFIKK